MSPAPTRGTDRLPVVHDPAASLAGKLRFKSSLSLSSSQTDRHAVVVIDTPFGQQPVVRCTGFSRIATNEQAWLVGMCLPGSVRIRDAHPQDATVAVGIFDPQSFNRLFVIGVRTRRGSDELRLWGQRPFCTVGINARTDCRTLVYSNSA